MATWWQPMPQFLQFKCILTNLEPNPKKKKFHDVFTKVTELSIEVGLLHNSIFMPRFVEDKSSAQIVRNIIVVQYMYHS